MRLLCVYILLGGVVHGQHANFKVEIGSSIQLFQNALQSPLIIQQSNLALEIENNMPGVNPRPYFGVGYVYSNPAISLGATIGFLNLQESIDVHLSIQDKVVEKKFNYNAYFPHFTAEFSYNALTFHVPNTNYRCKSAFNFGFQLLFPSFYSAPKQSVEQVEIAGSNYIITSTAQQYISRYHPLALIGVKFVFSKEHRDKFGVTFRYQSGNSITSAISHTIEITSPNQSPRLNYIYFSNLNNAYLSIGLEWYLLPKLRS